MRLIGWCSVTQVTFPTLRSFTHFWPRTFLDWHGPLRNNKKTRNFCSRNNKKATWNWPDLLRPCQVFTKTGPMYDRHCIHRMLCSRLMCPLICLLYSETDRGMGLLERITAGDHRSLLQLQLYDVSDRDSGKRERGIELYWIHHYSNCACSTCSRLPERAQAPLAATSISNNKYTNIRVGQTICATVYCD